MSRRRWLLGLAGALGLVAVALVAASQIGTIVQWTMIPGVAFADQTPPPAPDYANPASWTALPDRADAADAVPTGSIAVDQTRAPVDAFYVHPTTYLGNHWNAPVDDDALNEVTDRVATGLQAPAFNGCCAVYGPRYRQANGTEFTHPSPDGERALDLAYGDVKRAFDVFNARRGDGRPFVLAAHSQGSVLAERLLFEAISGTPLRDQLVVAIVPGGSITAAGLRERAPDVPPCRTRDDLHCVAAFNARGPRYVPGQFELRRADAREPCARTPCRGATTASPPPPATTSAPCSSRPTRRPARGSPTPAASTAG